MAVDCQSRLDTKRVFGGWKHSGQRSRGIRHEIRSLQVPSTENPVQGVRARGRKSLLVQPRLAWGVFSLVTSETGPLTRLGIGPKKPMTKSSTMRGAKALASESDRRRCRTAKNLLLRGTGGASVFCPQKSPGIVDPRRKLCRAGRRGHTATGPWVTPL